MTRLRFYIGLHGPHGVLVSHEDAQDYIIDVYGAYTAIHANGAWRGEREPSVVYEILSERPVLIGEAEVDAKALRTLCQQESVLYTVETVPGGFV